MQAQGVRDNTSRSNGRGNAGMGRGAPAAGVAKPGAAPVTPGALRRAIAYIGHYRRLAVWAYGSLILATAAQLVVPQLLQSIIDAVVKAFTANEVLKLPAQFLPVAAQRLG